MQAPKTKKIPYTHVAHGEVRHDPYFWLRDIEHDPDVMRHIEAENRYCQVVMAENESLQQQISDEIRQRIRDEWSSVPIADGPYFYYSRYQKGEEYPLFCRRLGESGSEEICLNEPLYAENEAYFDVGAVEISPDHRLLMWAVDQQGDEQYQLRLRDLSLDCDLPAILTGCSSSFCWMNDNRHCIYVALDAQNRPLSVYRHRLGSAQTEDACLLELPEGDLFLSVERTRSNRWVIITASGSSCSVCWALDADDPTAQPMLIAPLREGVEYYVDHRSIDYRCVDHKAADHRIADHLIADRGIPPKAKGEFWLLTNDDHPNFRIAKVDDTLCDPAKWQTVIAGSDDRLLDGISCFADFITYSSVSEGLTRLHIWHGEAQPEQQIAFDDAAWDCGFGANPDYYTQQVRYSYSTFIRPVAVMQYDIASSQSSVLQQDELAGFDPDKFEILRLWANGHDGARIPMTMVKPKSVQTPAPLVLCGYGAYGDIDDLGLARSWLPLLERGMICVQAHVRGSATCGRTWYEQGKLAHKNNSFTDLIACAEHLIAARYTRAGQIGLYGGSAGGLLVAGALNLRAELFGAVVAAVPFVDTLTTMLDASLPLTCLEYEEWGCPEEPEAYGWIRAYSPYDNLKEQHYPPILATAGLHDTRVTYWEPMKWVARIRDMQQGCAPVLCHIETDAGHGGASGRYEWIAESALIDAFLIRHLSANAKIPFGC
ncbi:MAG: S9 family peptidase [Plesiomonas sp.]|uniref:S9 family peptidase n=1 Tax=Plesiomonas sp. TaxID=2486279 RepID=UPI003F400718